MDREKLAGNGGSILRNALLSTLAAVTLISELAVAAKFERLCFTEEEARALEEQLQDYEFRNKWKKALRSSRPEFLGQPTLSEVFQKEIHEWLTGYYTCDSGA